VKYLYLVAACCRIQILTAYCYSKEHILSLGVDDTYENHRKYTELRILTVTASLQQCQTDKSHSTKEQACAQKSIMYFSFSPSPPATSYSTAPMNIPSSSSARPQSPSCAYPSWPRRSSLSSNSGSSFEDEAHSSSFITDEELFPCVFDDAEQDCTPPATPSLSRSPASPNMMCEARVVVDNGSLMRELVAQEKAKKERRRRKSSSSSRKSRSSSATSKHMSPIQEVVE